MRTLFCLLIFLSVYQVAQAQFPVKEYQSSPVTFYGIDYTKTRMIGAVGFSEPEKIVNVYFNAWNTFVKTEPDKYDIRRYFYKPDIKINLTLSRKRNETVDYREIVIEDPVRLTDEGVVAILDAYDFEGEIGIGTMLIAENYDKYEMKGSYCLIFFEIGSKNILYKERYVGKAQGFGFRNYWARTYYEVLRQIEKRMKKRLR